MSIEHVGDAQAGGDEPGEPGAGADAGPRGPWRDYRAALDEVGFRPSRRLGQNFLLDDNVVRAIVREAGVEPGDLVLEVGPGVGFLTRALLDAGARVVAVEIDRRLFEIVLRLHGAHPALKLLRADVLASKHTLAPEVLAELPASSAWRLVANLPYSISGPFLAALDDLDHPPGTMTVLVQREVAERIAAGAGTSAYGTLSARLQASFVARVGRPVPPHLFWPRPEVESSLVHLVRRPDAPPRAERLALAALLAALFPRRRQVLRRVLGDVLGDKAAALAALEQAGLDPGLRVEAVGPDALLGLSRLLALPPRSSRA